MLLFAVIFQRRPCRFSYKPFDLYVLIVRLKWMHGKLDIYNRSGFNFFFFLLVIDLSHQRPNYYILLQFFIISFDCFFHYYIYIYIYIYIFLQDFTRIQLIISPSAYLEAHAYMKENVLFC
jgi:hypothetical protein